MQPVNECGCGDIIATVINQGHLNMKIADAMFECLSLPHLERKEMVVLLEFLSIGVLVEEGITDSSKL